MPSRGIARLHSTSLPSTLCGLDPRHSSRKSDAANVTKPKPRDLQCRRLHKFENETRTWFCHADNFLVPVTHTSTHHSYSVSVSAAFFSRVNPCWAADKWSGHSTGQIPFLLTTQQSQNTEEMWRASKCGLVHW